jgi:hypothetical protein
MEKVYVVSYYSNYQNQKYYTPYKKAFLSREKVIEFLISKLDEEMKSSGYWIEWKDEDIKDINNNLSLNLRYGYGNYRYVTEEISLVEFN